MSEDTAVDRGIPYPAKPDRRAKLVRSREPGSVRLRLSRPYEAISRSPEAWPAIHLDRAA